ncbi:6420_t:CDS:2 [Diversispora eburnea]|uniref:6420_t:CDS:1 n=1 Tax=Diversispora eburnea TaxID=1213867 RepID=A0A9N8VNA2_9GLOM|nr:6420_t:CDS:2 [Diversispora eburnea]
MTNINNPDYDLKEFENIIENYKKDEFAYLNQYYTKYYLLGTNEKITEDFYIYQAPNKLCVIGLAPSHPLLQPQPQQQNQLPKIKNIEYNTKAVNTINKKKQNLLSFTSKICAITTITTEQEEKRYQIMAGVVGYIAIIKPKHDNPNIALGHCISEEQYNKYIIKLSGENTT